MHRAKDFFRNMRNHMRTSKALATDESVCKSDRDQDTIPEPESKPEPDSDQDSFPDVGELQAPSPPIPPPFMNPPASPKQPMTRLTSPLLSPRPRRVWGGSGSMCASNTPTSIDMPASPPSERWTEWSPLSSPSTSPGLCLGSHENRSHSHSSVSNQCGSASSICIEQDLQYLRQVEWRDTTPYVPNVRYGKVLSVLDGRRFVAAARLYNGYTSTLPPKTYRIEMILAGVDVAGMDTPAGQDAHTALSGAILHRVVEIVPVDPQTDFGSRLGVHVYTGGRHVNRWMIDHDYGVAT